MMPLSEAPQPLETVRQTVHRVKAWLRKFTSQEVGEADLPEHCGCEPQGADSSSTLVDVPSSSNTCSPSPSERQRQAQPSERPLEHSQQHSHQQQQSGAAPAEKVKPLVPDTREFFAEYGEANRYLIREVIGKGSYGIVCSAVDQFTGEKVAIKKITNVFEHVSDATRILREIKLLRMLKHPDIVDIKHIMLPPNPSDFKDIYVVFELMETDLHQVIKANDDLTHDHHQFFLYQMLRGLKYIHSARVFHRDLKPKNILANSDCKLKICDFGLARPAFNDVPTAILWTDYVATRWYRAPELCGSFFAKYSPAIDIWSVGCIFAEVLLGKPLFPGKNVAHQLEIITDLLGTPPPHVLEKVRNEKARRFLMAMRPKPGIPFQAFFPRAAPAALALLRRMLSFDPAERPTAEEALVDPYFAGLHSPSREPVAQPISKLAFEFDRRKLEMNDVRDLIYREILEYHPQVLRAQMTQGVRSPYVHPSSLDAHYRQFMHMDPAPAPSSAALETRGSNGAAGVPSTSAAAAYASSAGRAPAAAAVQAPYMYAPEVPVDANGSYIVPDSHTRRGSDASDRGGEASRLKEQRMFHQHSYSSLGSVPPHAGTSAASFHAAATAADHMRAAAAVAAQTSQQHRGVSHGYPSHASHQPQHHHHHHQSQPAVLQGSAYVQQMLIQQQQQQQSQQHHAQASSQQQQQQHAQQIWSQHYVPAAAAAGSTGAGSSGTWVYDASAVLPAQHSMPAAMPAGSHRDQRIPMSGKDRQASAPAAAYIPSPMLVDSGAGVSHGHTTTHVYATGAQHGGSASSTNSATIGMSGVTVEQLNQLGMTTAEYTSIYASSMVTGSMYARDK